MRGQCPLAELQVFGGEELAAYICACLPEFLGEVGWHDNGALRYPKIGFFAQLCAQFASQSGIVFGGVGFVDVPANFRNHMLLGIGKQKLGICFTGVCMCRAFLVV
jgi:hypothetical protein